MKYTRLGETGVQVSRICLGCMSYGDPGWRPWILDENEASPHFKSALEAGVNFFDTANMYSNIEETLDALDSLIRSGKVRYIGASSMAA